MNNRDRVLRWMLIFLTMAMFSVLTACKNEDEQKIIEDVATIDTTYKVYYLTESEMSIEGATWSYNSETAGALVDECLTVLATKPEEKAYRAPIQEPVRVVRYEYHEEKKQADIYFNDAYKQLKKEQEILCRAAIVKTLTQFDSVVDYVQFFVNGEALKDAEGNLQIMMQSDFVESTSADIKNLNESTLKLYYASTDGQQLAQEDVYVHYLNTAPVERVIVESLASGPLSDNLNRTFAEDTKLNAVSVSDGICYVDLNQKFLEPVSGQNFRVKVYSIVNSLCALDSIEQVQILINGQIESYEADGVNIESPLKEDESIVAKPVDIPPVLENT